MKRLLLFWFRCCSPCWGFLFHSKFVCFLRSLDVTYIWTRTDVKNYIYTDWIAHPDFSGRPMLFQLILAERDDWDKQRMMAVNKWYSEICRREFEATLTKAQSTSCCWCISCFQCFRFSSWFSPFITARLPIWHHKWYKTTSSLISWIMKVNAHLSSSISVIAHWKWIYSEKFDLCKYTPINSFYIFVQHHYKEIYRFPSLFQTANRKIKSDHNVFHSIYLQLHHITKLNLFVCGHTKHKHAHRTRSIRLQHEALLAISKRGMLYEIDLWLTDGMNANERERFWSIFSSFISFYFVEESFGEKNEIDSRLPRIAHTVARIDDIICSCVRRGAICNIEIIGMEYQIKGRELHLEEKLGIADDAWKYVVPDHFGSLPAHWISIFVVVEACCARWTMTQWDLSCLGIVHSGNRTLWACKHALRYICVTFLFRGKTSYAYRTMARSLYSRMAEIFSHLIMIKDLWRNFSFCLAFGQIVWNCYL